MATRIGINGFGRIGRSVYRILGERDDFEIVAVNDLFDNDQLAYLLRYDTVMRKFDKSVDLDGDILTVGNMTTRLTTVADPAEIPWRELGAEIVIESTGVFRTREALEKHLRAGAEKVLLTVPAKDEIDATIVIGVNDADLHRDHRIVSNASCTTNCLAPVVKVLDDKFGLVEGFVTTVHAYTNDQRLADVPHKDPRRSRAAAQNIIPTTTGAARAVGKVLPHLQGKLDGMAMRVPVPDGSIVDLVCKLGKQPGREAINEALRVAAQDPRMSGILEYSECPLVSSDIIGNAHSSIVDGLSTIATGDGYAKVVSWYDNEWGYANRVVDLMDRMIAN